MAGVGNLNPSTLTVGSYTHVTIATGSVDSGAYRVEIHEMAGRRGRNTSGIDTAQRDFLVKGTTDPLAAKDGLINGSLPINQYDGLNITELEHEVFSDTYDAWKFTASYDNATPNVDTGDYVVSIDTTGGQLIQTYGYAANSKYNATGETATDYGKALNVQDGQPQGISRVIPTLKLSITARIATEYVVRPLAYAKICAGLTGFTNSTGMFPYNSNPDYEFAVGELLFTGVTGVVVSENPQLTFTFLASENLSSQTIGDITGITKKGHQLLWFEFRNSQDATTKRLTQKAIGAHVGTVYGEADLSALKIGTLPT